MQELLIPTTQLDMLSEKFTKNKKQNKAKAGRSAQHSVATTGPQLKRREFLSTSSVDAGSGSNGFDPLDIAGCQLWLRADSITGQNDTEDLVSWSDESDQSQTVSIPLLSSQRPHYRTNVINSKPAIEFIRTAEMHLGLPTSLHTTMQSDCSIFVVSQPGEVATNDQWIIGSHSDNSFSSSTVQSKSSLVIGIDDSSKMVIKGKTMNTNTIAAGSALTDDNNYIFCVLHDNSEDDLWQYQDASKSGKETSMSVGSAGSPTWTGIGAYADSGGRGGLSVSLEYEGYIAEIIIYNSILSERNLVDVHHYLGNKYRINVPAASKIRY